jgi:hypothetical protein
VAVLWTYPAALAGTSAAAGTAVTAAALTAGTPTPVPVLPPIQVAGTRLRVHAHLEMTSTSATPTLTIDIRLGAVAGAIGSATVLGSTPANAMSASAAAWPIKLFWEGTFRNLGTAVTMHGAGEQLYGTSLTAWTSTPFPVTAAARTTAATINTEINNQLDIGITLSSITGSPSVTVTELHVTLDG